MPDTSKPKPLAHFPSAMAQDHIPVNTPGRGRHFRRVFKSLFVIVLVAGVSVAGLLYYLSRGPVSNERLRVEIVSVLSSVLGPNLSAEVTEARISFGKSGILSVAANQVKIAEKTGGEPYGEAAQINIGIKLLALLRGEYKVDSILVEDSTVDVQRIGLQNRDWSVKWPDALHLEEVMRIPAGRLFYLSQSMGIAGLEKVTWRNLQIVGLRMSSAMNKDITIRRLVVKVQDETGKLSINANARFGRRDVLLTGTWEKIDGSFTLKLNLTGLDASDFLPNAADIGDGAFGLNAPIEVSYTHPYGPDLTPGRSSLSVEISPGKMRFGYDDLVDFSGGTLNFRLLPSKNQIELEPSTVRFTNSSALLTGGIRFPLSSSTGAVISTVTQGGENLDASKLNNPIFELIANDIVADPSDSDGPPIGATVKVVGRLNPIEKIIEMDEINLWSKGGNLVGAGSLGFIGETPSLALALTIPKMSITTLKQIWPIFIATKARRWVLDHIDGGEVVGARIDAALPAGVLGNVREGKKMLPDQLSVYMNVVDTNIKTIGDIPTISNASGTMLFQGMETTVKLEKGTVYFDDGRVVEASGGILSIGDFQDKPTIAKLKLGLKGSASDILAIGDKKPLHVVETVKIKPSEVTGNAKLDLKLKFPLRASLAGADVDWSALLNLSDVAVSKPIGGRKLSRANVSIEAAPGIAAIKGKVRIDGIPSTIDVEQPFGDNRQAGSKGDIKLFLDQKARKKLGLNLGEIVKGPISVLITTTGDADVSKVKVDLTRSTLNLPWINWTKGRGIKGTAEFTMRTGKNNTIIDNLKLYGTGFQVAGDFTLDKKGIVKAKISQLSLNKGDKLKVTIARTKRGYSVIARGPSYDARGVINQIISKGAPKLKAIRKQRIDLQALIDKVTGFGNEALLDVNLQYVQANGELARTYMTGRTNGSLKTTLSIIPEGGTTTTTLISSNAGAALRFLNIYSRMNSGQLSAKFVQKGRGPHRGIVKVEKFRLKNEPRLKRLLSTKEWLGNRENRDLPEAIVKSGINPDDVKINITTAEIIKDDKSLIIKEGILRASDVGSNFSGTVYNASGNMDLKGTYLPGYGLNRIAGKIPIVGLAFGDGTSRGFLGVTYRLRGKAKNPTITINPISAITPGIFRKVFEFK